MGYWTAQDKAAERHAAAQLESAWGVRLLENPDTYDCFDFYGYRGSAQVVRSLIEIKARNMSWGQYPDVVLSCEKVEALLPVARFFDARPLLVVVALQSQSLHWVDLTRAPEWDTRIGGRTRNVRRDKDRDEFVYTIPAAAFTPVMNA